PPSRLPGRPDEGSRSAVGRDMMGSVGRRRRRGPQDRGRRGAANRARIGAAMADRSNHYEAAFEAYVRAQRVPCVAIDEARRALADDGGLKSPDFLLYPREGPNLVVEVKGKRGKNASGRRRWENWVTTDDLDGL